MIAISHKTKQYLLVAAKVLIIAVTFGYIFYKLSSPDSQSLGYFLMSLELTNHFGNPYILSFLFLLVLSNWFFEILKWKTVVSVIENINFKTAAKQCLASLTVSLTTPNRIGEYGAKAFFFSSEKRKKILFLNFFSNVAQMFVSCFFGIIGLIIVYITYEMPIARNNILIIVLLTFLLLLLAFFFREKQFFFKGFSINGILLQLKKISLKIKGYVIIFALLRYISFSFLFHYLIITFAWPISLTVSMPLIFTMYFLVSIVPTFFIFDVVIRGGVAVWLFSFIGVPELIILSTVLAMWLLNFVLPALFGSFFVLTYQPATK